MIRLSTGAEMRLTGPTDRAAIVCLNGGQQAPVEGTWSASLEWLVGHLAPRFPSIAFSEVRYRVKSWRRLDLCEEDARAAVAETDAPRSLLLGFSMGGVVAACSADAPSVEGVLGLAPWLPDRAPLDRLEGKRLDVLHGTLDRWLPGVPGVSSSSSKRGYERARRLGVEGSYRLIPGAVHGVALRTPVGVVPTSPGRPLGRPGGRTDRRVGDVIAEQVGTA